MKMFLLTVILFGAILPSYADGYLSVTPGHDTINGNGGDLSFEMDQHIRGPLSFNGSLTLSKFDTYQDVLGIVGLDYEYSRRVTLGAGYSYDRFASLDGPGAPFYARNFYGRVKVKLW